ncbi:MAG: ClpX C4-type zinc finger protein [Gammaproteobacteria bacterium]|nr:ClpX C4-type zinc finger protein [Gammaproteobacteria bacterium]
MSGKIRCAFCGQDETQVEKMVAGGRKSLLLQRAYMCGDCVTAAYDIIKGPEPPTAAPSAVAAGREIRAA